MQQESHNPPPTPWWGRLLLLLMLLPFVFGALVCFACLWFAADFWQGRFADHYDAVVFSLFGGLLAWYVAAIGYRILRNRIQ